MNANRFVRSFVLLSQTAKDIGLPKPSKLKDLYVGQKHGKLVKPWVKAPDSDRAAAYAVGPHFQHLNLMQQEGLGMRASS
jgi:hypothetical protein